MAPYQPKVRWKAHAALHCMHNWANYGQCALGYELPMGYGLWAMGSELSAGVPSVSSNPFGLSSKEWARMETKPGKWGPRGSCKAAHAGARQAKRAEKRGRALEGLLFVLPLRWLSGCETSGHTLPSNNPTLPHWENAANMELTPNGGQLVSRLVAINNCLRLCVITSRPTHT